MRGELFEDDERGDPVVDDRGDGNADEDDDREDVCDRDGDGLNLCK